jgi:hypothetical protein
VLALAASLGPRRGALRVFGVFVMKAPILVGPYEFPLRLLGTLGSYFVFATLNLSERSIQMQIQGGECRLPHQPDCHIIPGLPPDHPEGAECHMSSHCPLGALPTRCIYHSVHCPSGAAPCPLAVTSPSLIEFKLHISDLLPSSMLLLHLDATGADLRVAVS